MQWISIKERLPEKGDIVVAWLMGIAEPACVKFTVDNLGPLWVELVTIDRYNNSRESRVSHWMPLPTAPKE